MTGDFKPNDAGFHAVANGPQVRRALAEAAERGKLYAESLAAEFVDSGEYAGSFEVREETIETAGRHPGPRAAVKLINSAPHAAAVEFGYGGRSASPNEVSAHRVLGRTLEYLEGSG